MQETVASSLHQMEETMQRGAAAALEQRASLVSVALSSLRLLQTHMSKTLVKPVLLVKSAISPPKAALGTTLPPRI